MSLQTAKRVLESYGFLMCNFKMKKLLGEGFSLNVG